MLRNFVLKLAPKNVDLRFPSSMYSGGLPVSNVQAASDDSILLGVKSTPCMNVHLSNFALKNSVSLNRASCMKVESVK